MNDLASMQLNLRGPIGAMLTVAAIWVVAWVLIHFVPMPEPGGKIIIAIAALFSLLVVLNAFGVW